MSKQTLSVTLPASTLYVSGTVNGVSVTWTNTEGNTWEAVADRAADDIYHVALTIIDENGQTSQAEVTLYYGLLNLITDRTAADVNAGNDKGTYKASDLNRVGAAMNYVAARLREQGYDPHISPKTDWMDSEWVTPADEAVYLGDLAELRKQFKLYYITPEVPPRISATGILNNDGLTYVWANNIEQILVDIDALLTNIAAGWLYSGEIYSGEV